MGSCGFGGARCWPAAGVAIMLISLASEDIIKNISDFIRQV